MAADKNLVGFVSCLANAADPDSRSVFLRELGKNGDTALHRASAGSRPDVIKTILMSVDQPSRISLLTAMNDLENTPIGIAVHKDNMDSLLCMLQLLSDVCKYGLE